MFYFSVATGWFAITCTICKRNRGKKTKYIQVCTYAIIFLGWISLSKRMLH